MGNRLNCARKVQKVDNETNAMFCPVQDVDMESITIPSKCEAPSFTLSVQCSQKSDSSQHFKWSRMMSLVVEQQHFTEQKLTRASLKLTAQVMEAVKKNLMDICNDVQTGVLSVPDPVLDKFRTLIEIKNSNPAVSCAINPGAPLTKKVLTHYVVMLYFHDIILGNFREGKNHEALELLKQIAVSHALKGVMPVDFRMMDWFLIHYLVKYQLVAEDGINNFITYLNTVSNHIAHFFKTQSVRGKTVKEMTTEKPQNDRLNKHRENYRLMKKWVNEVQDYKKYEQIVEALLDQNKPDLLKDKEGSIDTLTLKKEDFIMKHFVRKDRRVSAVSVNPSERRSTKISGFA